MPIVKQNNHRFDAGQFFAPPPEEFREHQAIVQEFIRNHGHKQVAAAIPDPPDFTIEYDGMKLLVPRWAGWIGQNSDGMIFAYEKEPIRNMHGFVSIEGRKKKLIEPEKYEVKIMAIDEFIGF